jgi:transcriptional regulator with XRE-family HTH domain
MPDQASSQNSSAGLEGFAARLTNVIAHTGLSQAEFARRLGVSAGFMSDAARGLEETWR